MMAFLVLGLDMSLFYNLQGSLGILSLHAGISVRIGAPLPPSR
jgi:hypothetical protein